ncbi:hypothetical protein QQF64_023717 [Cirrhinus molitorella]|uniref:Uncharacterized protein n=1 Tax=Cirrhinus molitorella TaxID=172907 RepID=A0ABR3NJF4_9TELE
MLTTIPPTQAVDAGFRGQKRMLDAHESLIGPEELKTSFFGLVQGLDPVVCERAPSFAAGYRKWRLRCRKRKGCNHVEARFAPSARFGGQPDSFCS